MKIPTSIKVLLMFFVFWAGSAFGFLAIGVGFKSIEYVLRFNFAAMWLLFILIMFVGGILGGIASCVWFWKRF